MTRHAALYLRLSPRSDGRYDGLDVQEANGRAYAAREWPGVPVVVYPDEGISAANGDHRPKYEALRGAVRAGEVAHVWAAEQSRLERREVQWFELAAELAAAGVDEVHTGREGVIRVGSVVAGIKAVISADEVRTLKKRVRDRLDANAANGTPAGSTPFGLSHAVNGDGVKTYAVDDDRADALRWAAGRVLAGWSLASAAAKLRDGSWPEDGSSKPMTGNHQVKTGELDARGRPVTRPGVITAASLRRMLTNPAVAGLRTHQGVIVGRGNWPAILDEPVWRAVRSRLASSRTVKRADGGSYQVDGPRAPAGRKYALTGGLAVCAVCGADMIATVKQVNGGAKRGGSDRASYICHPLKGGRSCTAIKADEFEAHVVERMFTMLSLTDIVDRVAADEHAARREEITTELSVIEGQRRDLAAMWAARTLTTVEWGTARAQLDEAERALNAELADKAAPPARAQIEQAAASWDRMDLGERREFIRMWVTRVTVGKATPGLQRFDPSRVGIEFA